MLQINEPSSATKAPASRAWSRWESKRESIKGNGSNKKRWYWIVENYASAKQICRIYSRLREQTRHWLFIILFCRTMVRWNGIYDVPIYLFCLFIVNWLLFVLCDFRNFLKTSNLRSCYIVLSEFSYNNLTRPTSGRKWIHIYCINSMQWLWINKILPFIKKTSKW